MFTHKHFTLIYFPSSFFFSSFSGTFSSSFDSSSPAIFGNINKIGGYFSLIDTSYNDIWFIKPFTFNNSEFNRVLMTCNLEQEYNYFYMGSTAIGSSIYTTVNYNGVDCKCITLFVKCLNPIDLYFSIPTDAYLVVSSLPNYIAYESSFVPLNTYTLNNAFHYGICEFNKIGFDKLNFVNWFTNLFVSNTSNLYVVFVNSYLNYMLFVECCIFLPYILLWFVRFCESIIDKFLGGAK